MEMARHREPDAKTFHSCREGLGTGGLAGRGTPHGVCSLHFQTRAHHHHLEETRPSRTFASSHMKNSSSSSSGLAPGLTLGVCKRKPKALCPAPFLLAAKDEGHVLAGAGRATPGTSSAGGCRRLRRSLGKRRRGQGPPAGLPTASPVSTLVSTGSRGARLSCSPPLTRACREGTSHLGGAAVVLQEEQQCR